jgi:hypothetical protein
MDECLVFAYFSLMWIVNEKPLSGMEIPWRTQLMISMTSMWVFFIIVKSLWFYLLLLIPLHISLCLKRRFRAESTIVTSVFNDLWIEMHCFCVHG